MQEETILITALLEAFEDSFLTFDIRDTLNEFITIVTSIKENDYLNENGYLNYKRNYFEKVNDICKTLGYNTVNFNNTGSTFFVIKKQN